MNRNSTWLALLALLAVSASLSGCLSQTSQAGSPAPQAQVLVTVAVSADGQVLATQTGSFAAGTPALDALKKLIPLEVKDSPMGAFVVSVAGKASPSGSYWALYVDGEYAKVGVSMLKLDKDTRLEWRLEKIEEAKVS